MNGERIVIIGGGLAGLSTGCYARMNGWETTILEHNQELGGVCGDGYRVARDAVAKKVLDLLVSELPEVRGCVRMTDVATPLSFWRGARSWRGAFEGWPTPDNFMRHVEKSLPGLEGFYMAGQWVEPGGGVPTALMSGRQLVQILCHEAGKPFLATPRKMPTASVLG